MIQLSGYSTLEAGIAKTAQDTKPTALQVAHTIGGLATSDEEALMLALERLARLAWNDNEVASNVTIHLQG